MKATIEELDTVMRPLLEGEALHANWNGDKGEFVISGKTGDQELDAIRKCVRDGIKLAIGIEDLGRPDYGDAVPIYPSETPVFWACGVTPMEAITRAKPDLAITHEPGHMFVTDVLDSSLYDDPGRS